MVMIIAVVPEILYAPCKHIDGFLDLLDSDPVPANPHLIVEHRRFMPLESAHLKTVNAAKRLELDPLEPFGLRLLHRPHPTLPEYNHRPILWLWVLGLGCTGCLL